MPTTPKTILASLNPSRSLARTCALFGLRVARNPNRKAERDALRFAHYAPAARQLEEMLAPGRIVLVTGESGAGKSTILELLARRLKLGTKRVHVVADPTRANTRAARDRRRKPIADLLEGDAARRLRALASCGLGDATLLARKPTELSEGQRARLALALAAQRARPGHTLICDEFAATLDRTTAMGLSTALARWAARERVQVVVATGNDDVTPALEAIVLRLPLSTPPPTQRAA